MRDAITYPCWIAVGVGAWINNYIKDTTNGVIIYPGINFYEYQLLK